MSSIEFWHSRYECKASCKNESSKLLVEIAFPSLLAVTTSFSASNLSRRRGSSKFFTEKAIVDSLLKPEKVHFCVAKAYLPGLAPTFSARPNTDRDGDQSYYTTWSMYQWVIGQLILNPFVLFNWIKQPLLDLLIC